VIIKRKITAGKIGPALQLKHGECVWFKRSFILFYFILFYLFIFFIWSQASDFQLMSQLTRIVFPPRMHYSFHVCRASSSLSAEIKLGADCNYPVLFNNHPATLRL
jgi:hypothetical protein